MDYPTDELTDWQIRKQIDYSSIVTQLEILNHMFSGIHNIPTSCYVDPIYN